MVRITTDAEKQAVRFKIEANAVGSLVAKRVAQSGQELLYLVQLGTSGSRGGPKYRTGKYHDSIRMEYRATPTMAMASVGTDEPYGYQLELGGFIPDPDTGEPVYHPPYPHFSIAMDYHEPDFIAELTNDIARFLK